MDGVATRRRSIGGLVRFLGRHRKASAAVLAALVVGVPWAWWATQLWGLPDVGDPFDAAAFEAVHVPDDRNAFVIYNEATPISTAAWKRFQNDHPDLARAKMPLEWSKAEPAWREHLEVQRPALDLWRIGTERPDARQIYPGGLTFHTIIEPSQQLRAMTRLAILRASKLESEGDMAGAWGWYRAVFRSSRHCGRHGFLIERAIGAAMHGEACEPTIRWASDPRVDAPLLRRALDELIAIDATTTPLSDPLKMEYLVFKNSVHDPSIINDLLIQKGQGDPTDWCDDLPVSNAAKRPIQAARILVADDRERSLRVVRLMAANWLAEVDKPASRRSKLAHREPPIYAPDPAAPPASRALAPEALARWVDSSLLAKQIATFQARFSPGIDRERNRQSRLVLHMAGELYRREHGGEAPPSPKALVGPYLKALPEGHDSAPEPAAAKP